MAHLIINYRHRRTAQIRLENRRLMRLQREELDPFTVMTDEGFRRAFRLPKDVCRRFMEIILPFMPVRMQTHAISNKTKILCALRFFASGSYQSPVGSDTFVGMSQPSVSRAIRLVAKVIDDNLSDSYIVFPTEHERAAIKERFYALGMPGVIGLVDGTHILIKKPTNDVEHVYYAVRKSAHSKNVQIICDADLRILAVNARYGGSAHDSFVWSNSYIRRMLEDEFTHGARNSYLLGDSGYGQQPWLFTPILNPRTEAEERYNVAHRRIRNAVERCIGVLKSRFRCLCRQRILMYSPEVCCTIINACVVLHNILIEEKYPLPNDEDINAEVEESSEANDGDIDPADLHLNGIDARDRMIREYFSE